MSKTASPVAAPDPQLTGTFLAEYFAFAPEEFYFHIFALNDDTDKEVIWFQISDLAPLVERIPELCESYRNLYFSTGIYRQPLRGRRGKSEDVAGICSLRADIDMY